MRDAERRRDFFVDLTAREQAEDVELALGQAARRFGARSTRSVNWGCARTLSHSPTSSGPGLSQIAFETLTRPMSWSQPASSTASISVAGKPSASAALRARCATRREWPSVNVDFKSA